MEDSPYKMLLDAGKLRVEASKTTMRAEMLESAARVALDQSPMSLSSTVLTPGVTLCVAFGGPADGHTERMGMESMKSPMLVSKQTMLPVPYMPGLMIQMHGLVVGAILIERNKAKEFIDVVRSSDKADTVAEVIAKMVTLSVGANSELAYGAVDQIVETMRQVPDHLDGPMLLNLGALS